MADLMQRIPRKLRHGLRRLLGYAPPAGARHSADPSPWNHPFLTTTNLARIHEYSRQVWAEARRCEAAALGPLHIAFCVNMAQSMTKWARLSKEAGAEAVLFPHPMDRSALNAPEWEVFDGQSANLFDADEFRRANPDLEPGVECRRIAWNGALFTEARHQFLMGDRGRYYELQAAAPTLRHELLFMHPQFGAYYTWARELQAFDVSIAASVPIGPYLSGRPYCAFSVGGDLQIDCGRADALGQVMGLAFNGARFLILGNPHPFAHCRRLGMANAVYLPYPMDDHRYCPGEARARQDWERHFGPGVYVLSSARIDHAVKGNGAAQLQTLIDAARARPALRFIFLAWGNDVGALQETVRQQALGEQFIFLPPVGKQRLIDYYRSADAVLDQFVYGYYGATALEAAAVGKPVIMRIRAEHYAPLYQGDVAPVFNCSKAAEIHQALLTLVDQPHVRQERGAMLRQWLVRHHGRERTMPVLLGLLRMAATEKSLPTELTSPLLDPLTDSEREYHLRCLSDAR
jgi:glycosyltransferase involved in cell wall biosynthesis